MAPKKKRELPEQQVKHLCEEVRERITHWKDICKNGCNDPGWADGCNMNLVRNHIIFYKQQIIKLCDENNLPYPEEICLQTPPQVNDNYMANLKQKRRVQRIGMENITQGKIQYDENQLSLF